MRLCAALALVLVALVVVTVRVTRRRPARAATPIATARAAPERRASAPRESAAPAAREAAGSASLRGRVLLPPGGETITDLEVVADDGARRFVALIRDHDRYEIHLPSGRYTLFASMGRLIGVAPDILAPADATRDVDIRLGAGVTIRGKLTAPAGTIVNAVRSGRYDDAGVPHVADGAFSIAGLIPGQRYDLTFSGLTVRTSTLKGVIAPAEGLDVQLQARARIRGAIGFPRGTLCPIRLVHLGSYSDDDDDDDDGNHAEVGNDCTFELSIPDNPADVTVIARGDGWHLEQRVAIPPNGDPEFLCLNPPCRSDPLEGLARLRITLEGPEGSRITAATSAGSENFHSCSSTEGRCDIDRLPVGETLSLEAFGHNCRSNPITVTVAAGDNDVRIACARQRLIEGVVRIPDGALTDGFAVRCAGSRVAHPIGNTRLFHVKCDASSNALEYQIGPEGIWRSAPIASATDPAFVDIAL